MIHHPAYSIYPLGDTALVIDFGNVINEQINKKVLHLFSALKERSLFYVVDIVPAYSSVAVYYDLLAAERIKESKETIYEAVAEEMEKIMAQQKEEYSTTPRMIEVPVCYAGKYALDIDEIAQQKNISIEEIIHLHTAKKYRVYMIGFLPGFAYMGEVDERIAAARKSQPRLNVQSGSVGIAGKQTGIYPLASPGGWQIIGRTPLLLFNKSRQDPVLFSPTDEVQFYSITENEFENYQSRNF
jgi:inhibitor of KinA